MSPARSGRIAGSFLLRRRDPPRLPGLLDAFGVPDDPEGRDGLVVRDAEEVAVSSHVLEPQQVRSCRAQWQAADGGSTLVVEADDTPELVQAGDPSAARRDH